MGSNSTEEVFVILLEIDDHFKRYRKEHEMLNTICSDIVLAVVLLISLLFHDLWDRMSKICKPCGRETYRI
jgi:hypothetical protein